MPRGSDAEAAGAELKARTGMVPNAEDLIAANQARMTKELRAASLRPVDAEATNEMDESEAQGFLEGDRTAVSWAVRGPFVVVVSEDAEGTLEKSAFMRKGKEKQAERAMRTGGRQTLAQRAEEVGEEKREERQEAGTPPPTAKRATRTT